MSEINTKNKYILGCDIGNGYAYVSLLLDSEQDPLPLFPARYQLSSLGMPTTAFITPPSGNLIEVFSKGKSAEERHTRQPQYFLRAVKTRLNEGYIKMNGIENPIEVAQAYAAIVRDLLILANEQLGHMGIEPVYDIIFTFPACFSDNVVILEQMKRCIESLTFDGKKVTVRGRLPEPAAVAIDYLHYMQHIAPENIRLKDDHFTVLVYDMGYGTFDTAVVTAQSTDNPYKLHLKDGLPEIGGKNFDDILYHEICRILKEEYQYTPTNEMARERIREAAVKVKHGLTDREDTMEEIEIQDDYLEVTITRERFEELSKHLLVQTLQLVDEILTEAEEADIHIDAVVLSGGASRMPMVKKGLEGLLGDEMPIVLYRPSESVSYGAARFAYGMASVEPKLDANPEPDSKSNPEPNPVLEQLTDCCYGIWEPSVNTLSGEIHFLIKCGESRPTVSKPFVFFSDESRISVKVYRLKEKHTDRDCASLEECESMMWFPFDVGVGVRCEVVLTVQEDYSIQVALTTNTGLKMKKSTSDSVEILCL